MALASKTLKHLYPDGLVEEIVLFYWEIVMKLHCVIPDDIKQAYCSWYHGVLDYTNFKSCN